MLRRSKVQVLKLFDWSEGQSVEICQERCWESRQNLDAAGLER